MPNPTFTEYLFGVIPARVAAGELPEKDPVARLSARHRNDIKWPTLGKEMQEFLDYLAWRAWSYMTGYPAAALRDVKWERSAMMQMLIPMMESLADELLATRHTLHLAWRDYEKHIQPKQKEETP